MHSNTLPFPSSPGWFCSLSLLLLMAFASCTGQNGAKRADPAPGLGLPALSAADARWVGELIFANECNLNIACLTSWNAGEDFPSLGIGHFIWYRTGQQEPFVESFPALLRFYQQRGHAVPEWLRHAPANPWQTREAFLADIDSPRMVELRQFLHGSMPVQVEFIIQRLHATLPQLRAASAHPAQLEQLFIEIATDSAAGMYALIDYVNFKGEGTSPSERYQGEGWGLLQVLEHMLDHPEPRPVLHRFSDSAREVLARRVRNSPPERGEQRWTNGWNNRVATYRNPP
jgi:hypothetical protein